MLWQKFVRRRRPNWENNLQKKNKKELKKQFFELDIFEFWNLVFQNGFLELWF